jgi:predicted dehydrogenase
MAKTYRVGVAKLVHDHVWGELKRWQALPNVQVVAAGDVHQRQRDRIQKEFGVPKVYDTWEAMLAAEDLDIVQIAAENSLHAEITEAAAAKGCHVLTEKPMAARLSQAERMIRATERAGVQLMVNWPNAWSPAWQEFERLLLDGAVGPITYLKYRSAHNGPREIGCDPEFWEWLYDGERNGAGAYMDYCCYAADLCARVLGLPQQVMGMRGIFAKDYPLPDDNAMVVMRYPHAFGVAEASWTQTVGYATPNPLAYGTGGSLAIDHGSLLLQRPGKEVETITPPPTAAPRRSAPEYFIHCLETGEPVEGYCSARVSRDAQEILEAGLRSADSGAFVTLPVTGEA